MNQDYLKNWTLMLGEMQKPFQKILDLNVKTFQNLKYLTLEEITSLKQPGELMDKQVELMMKNSHIILDSMAQSFQLLESTGLSFSKQFKEKTVESKVHSGVEQGKKQTMFAEMIPTQNISKKPSRNKKPIAANEKILINSKNKKASNNSALQNKEKPKPKLTESIRKKDSPHSENKKEIAANKAVLPKNKNAKSNLIITNEVQKNSLKLDKDVSDKKKHSKKIRLTKLERKMGMPEPVPDLLLTSMDIPADSMSNLSNIQISTPEHPKSHYDHPLLEQKGRGKTPFKK